MYKPKVDSVDKRDKAALVSKHILNLQIDRIVIFENKTVISHREKRHTYSRKHLFMRV